MVEFVKTGDEIDAVQESPGFNPSSMMLKFIEDETAVFINPSTGAVDEVPLEDVPNEFLKSELEFQRERLENTGNERIKELVSKLEELVD